MGYGKTIELFLVNGTAESLTTAELSNWNGRAVKIPRLEVADCNRDDVRAAGVYFLFCEEEDGTPAVYIGEAENVQERLIQHIRDYNSGKETYYWNTAVIFVGRDLNKASIRYLENRLVALAKQSGRYKILTKNTYQNTVLKESHKASLEEFIDNIKILINALGYKVLTPAPVAEPDTVYLYCVGSGANGKGFVSNGGLTVMEGSKVSDHTVPSFETRGKSYALLRKRLVADGVIVDGVFVRDYEFSAPSAASAVLLGHTSNGNADWKTETGVKLKDL